MAFNRVAVMGIGTLIIFIATILVAAVAAGVIISTSGVLQQKALIIGDQAQNRLINGIEITHVFFTGNTTDKTANNLEILTRPEPAAGPINFRTTSLSFFTDEGAYSAELEHPTLISKNFSIGVPVTTAWTAFGDLDGDGLSDSVRVLLSGGSGPDFLQFNLSETGLTDNVSLGVNIETGGYAINVTDLVITGLNNTYGYVHIADASGGANQIDANVMRVTDFFEGDCTFAKVIPETHYCLVTLNGRDDYYLEYGETVFIYYRLKSHNRLSENDEFEIKVFPQDGRSTYILDRLPSVIYKQRLSVYP
jgi:flagellin FlaB